MNEQKPTADYRKYPKGPNFGLIVGLAVAVLLLIFIGALIFLHHDARKADPHRSNPHPNALSRPGPLDGPGRRLAA